MDVPRSKADVFSANELAERTLRRRAVEATIWGMPAVSMAAIRASLRRDLDAEPGDVIYFSNVMEPRHEFHSSSDSGTLSRPSR